MLHVIATIQVADGKREQFLTELRRLVPLVRQEQGCLEFGPAVDVPSGHASQGPVRDDVVTVVEKWINLAALNRHSAASHMQDYRTRVKELVVRSSIQVMQSVAS